jgi:hypothetical protein
MILLKKKARIKFSLGTLKIAKQVLKSKKLIDIFFVVKKGEEKSAGKKDICEILLGEKQNSNSEVRAYTDDIQNTEKLFLEYFLEKLNMVICPSYFTVLYILKAKEAEFNKIVIPKTEWPIGIVKEHEVSSMNKFEKEVKKADNFFDILN